MEGKVHYAASDYIPPKAPNPTADSGLADVIRSSHEAQINSPLVLCSDEWDFDMATPSGAVRLLIDAVQSLIDATGEVLPTPPLSRSHSPTGRYREILSPTTSQDSFSPMSPISPTSPNSSRTFTPMSLPSPETQRDETCSPVELLTEIDYVANQNAAVSRRFFLKTAPPFSLSEYLLRIHKYCPHSSGVYLTAAAYVYQLCVVDQHVPTTSRTAHRICLAAIRVASKVLEDHKWSQDRMCKVGGVGNREFKALEINLCFLLDFELFVREHDLKKKVFNLQQAGKQGFTTAKGLGERRLSIQPKVGMTPPAD